MNDPRYFVQIAHWCVVRSTIVASVIQVHAKMIDFQHPIVWQIRQAHRSVVFKHKSGQPLSVRAALAMHVKNAGGF